MDSLVQCIHLKYTCSAHSKQPSSPSCTHSLRPQSSALALNLKQRLQRRKCMVFTRANKRDLDDKSAYLGEDGTATDMDKYMNNLSLEYDSVWDTKPAWCQPWTITLTGVVAVSGSWFLIHSIILTLCISTLVGAWWYIFLYSYPKGYSEMIAERRSRVKNGLEDTYGNLDQKQF